MEKHGFPRAHASRDSNDLHIRLLMLLIARCSFEQFIHMDHPSETCFDAFVITSQHNFFSFCFIPVRSGVKIYRQCNG